MSTLTKAQRDELPVSAFCDRAGRKYPILDQNDVDSAASLIGKAANKQAVKDCVIAKAKAKGWKIPEAWQTADHSVVSTTPHDAVTVTFGLTAAPSADADEYVTWRGKIFEAGQYPDKAFDISPEEIDVAIEQFTAQHLDLEHIPTVLSGKLGALTAVHPGDDGWSLYGEARVPKWLDTVLPADERKVSATWNRTTKQLEGLALVIDPRVADAALASYAAFAKRHDTPHGQMAMQDLHDTSARHGAVCSSANAQMASRHEASAIQQAHDLAVTHGAACASTSGPKGPAMYSGAEASQRKGGSIMSWLNDLFKVAKEAPADFDAEAAFSAMKPTATLISGETLTQATTPAAQYSAGPSAAEQERDSIKAELARLKAERIAEQAAAFATKYIETEHRAHVAERDAIVAAYTIAAQDDISYGQATFANGTTTSRVAALARQYDARPAHQLTVEQLVPGMQALFNQATTPDPDARNRPLDRAGVVALMEQTSLGRQALAQMK